MELTHEQRVVACEQLAADLAEKGWVTKTWVSTQGVNPGCGVEVRKVAEGDIWASITVNTRGYVSFQKVWDELSPKQINQLGDDATYDGDEPVRPSQQYTKVLPQTNEASPKDSMQGGGGGRGSGLMARLGFAEKPAKPIAKLVAPKATHGKLTGKKSADDDNDSTPPF